jgi:hypothetical protein
MFGRSTMFQGKREATHQCTRETLSNWRIRTNTYRTHPHGINISLDTNLPRQATEVSCISIKGRTINVRSVPEIPATICTNRCRLERWLACTLYCTISFEEEIVAYRSSHQLDSKPRRCLRVQIARTSRS